MTRHHNTHLAGPQERAWRANEGHDREPDGEPEVTEEKGGDDPEMEGQEVRVQEPPAAELEVEAEKAQQGQVGSREGEMGEPPDGATTTRAMRWVYLQKDLRRVLPGGLHRPGPGQG